MNKIVFGVFVTLIAVAISAFTSYGVIKYGKHGLVKETYVTEPQVKDCVLSVVDPQMTSFADVYDLQENMHTSAFIDSVFISMPYKTLQDVSSVTIKKKGFATKGDIVDEFLGNKQIYENLPPPEASNANTSTTKKDSTPILDIKLVKEGTTTVTEGQPTRVGYSGAYKDTTINGKKALIQTE